MYKCPFSPCTNCPYRERHRAMQDNFLDTNSEPNFYVNDEDNKESEPEDDFDYTVMDDAFLRFLHSAPNSPAVDIYIDGEMAIDDLPYGELTGYIPLSSGVHKVEVYPFDKTTSPILTSTINLKDDSYNSLSVVGTPSAIDIVIIEDYDKLIPKNTAMVKFAHLVPDAPNVDITTDSGQKIINDVPYKKVSPYINVTPGTYDLQIRPSGQKDAILTIPSFEIRGGEAYTIFALGLLNGTPPVIGALVEDMM